MKQNTDGHGRTRTGEAGLIPKHGGYRNLKSFQVSEVIYDVTVRFCEKYVDRFSRTRDQMVQAARSGRQNIAEGSVDSATSKKIELKLTGVAKGSLEELRLDYEDFLRQRGLPEWEPDHPVLQRFKALRCATLGEFRAWVADEVRRAKENTDGHSKNTDGHSKNTDGHSKNTDGHSKNTDGHSKNTDGHSKNTDGHSKNTDGHSKNTDGHSKNTDGHRLARTQSAKSNSVRVGPCQSVSPKDLPAVLAANGELSLLNLCIYLLDRQMKAQGKAFEEEGGFTERLYRRRTERRQKENH